MGQHHLAEVDAVALTAEVEQWDQPLEKQKSLLDVGIAVVEDLAQECIQAHEGTHVVPEQKQRVEHVLGAV